MTEDEKRGAAEYHVSQLRLARMYRRELEERVRRYERMAAFLGCPDLEKLPRACAHHDALAVLRDLRAQLIDDIQQNDRALEDLLQLARDSPHVEAVVLHVLEGLTWEKVAQRMCYSHTNVRRMERAGLLMVYDLLVADAGARSDWCAVVHLR